jgi:hypothetical protein
VADADALCYEQSILYNDWDDARQTEVKRK